MKNKLVSLLLPLALLGCSKQQPPASSSTATGSATKTAVAAPQINFVESPETTEQNLIKSQAWTLYTNKDYAGLEAMATNYRASKERYATGFWKLALVYNALEPARKGSDADWQAQFKQIQDWIKARPTAVVPRIALARMLTSYAWKARGGDWADKVKEADWNLFFARLKKAMTSLQEAKQLKEKCPVYWSSLQMIALGMQFEKPRYNTVFSQAIQEFPDYEYYYNARANYLQPRWHGEEGEWEKDLTKSADRVGGAAGDMLYAQVVWDVNHHGGVGSAGPFLKINKSAWERVDKGFGVILQQFPDSLAAKNARAFLAALAGEKEKARTYFLETKGLVDLKQWGEQKNIDNFLEWAFSP